MSEKKPSVDPAVDGKGLDEVNPPLFLETMDALRSRDISPAAAALNEDEAPIVAAKFVAARLRDFCRCGDSNCATYYFHVPEKLEGSVRCSTVRFYARGEHLLHIDSDGDVYGVERLYDVAGGPRTIYAKGADGTWESRELR